MKPSSYAKALSLKKLPVGTVVMFRRRDDGLWVGEIAAPDGRVQGESGELRKLLTKLAKRYAAERGIPLTPEENGPKEVGQS
jgi:hypothetical protein